MNELVQGAFQPLLIELNIGSGVFFQHGVFLFLWKVGADIGNGYGIRGQNCIGMYQQSDG